MNVPDGIVISGLSILSTTLIGVGAWMIRELRALRSKVDNIEVALRCFVPKSKDVL